MGQCNLHPHRHRDNHVLPLKPKTLVWTYFLLYQDHSMVDHVLDRQSWCGRGVWQRSLTSYCWSLPVSEVKPCWSKWKPMLTFFFCSVFFLIPMIYSAVMLHRHRIAVQTVVESSSVWVMPEKHCMQSVTIIHMTSTNHGGWPWQCRKIICNEPQSR